MKYHTNLGHPSRDQLLRTLRTARAKPEIVQYVAREFSCPDCRAHARSDHRTFQFNKIIGIDTFKVTFGGGILSFLNIICHGTNLNVVSYLGKDFTADGAWQGFARSWLTLFGPLEVLVSDGGPEFQGIFARRLEQAGAFHHVTDAEAPWQNGRVERHGQWIQDLLVKSLETNFVKNEQELELLACEIAANKNRYMHRGGFSPFQLVFGANPRLPHELLSDDPICAVGLEDLRESAINSDSVAAEFTRQQEIWRMARDLLLCHDASHKLAAAAAT